MKIYLEGKYYDYSEATWEQLCDFRTLVIAEPEKDAINPARLSEEAQNHRCGSLNNLKEWADYWALPWHRRLFKKEPKIQRVKLRVKRNILKL